MFDFHMHSRVSFDGKDTGLQMALAAKEAGLKEICFTDHIDYDPAAEVQTMVFDPLAYAAEYDALEVPGLRIRRGMEFGMLPDNRAQLETDLQRRSFDFVIGSIHLLDDEDPYYESYWTNRSAKDVLSKYFNDMLSSIREYDNFDSLGHLDYIIRYIPSCCGSKDYIYREYADVLDEIFQLLIAKNKALEINTAGLAKGLPCFHPKLKSLQRYLELGGELITIGSDAHSPDKLATKFSVTEELLRSCHLKGYYVYKNRIPEFHTF